jgi:hypothetical protein
MLNVYPWMFLSVALGGAGGSFLWQAFEAGDWKTAAERSFVQAWALGTLWVVARIARIFKAAP